MQEVLQLNNAKGHLEIIPFMKQEFQPFIQVLKCDIKFTSTALFRWLKMFASLSPLLNPANIHEVSSKHRVLLEDEEYSEE